MKKTICATFFMGMMTAGYALSNDEIIKHYQRALDNKIPNFSSNISLEILERKPAIDDFEQILIEADLSGNKRKDVVFARGDFLFNDITNAKTGESLKNTYLEKINASDKNELDKKLLSVLKQEKSILTLGNKNKEEVYIFTDPECPFCQRQLGELEDMIKTKKVHLVFVSVHGDNAFAKGISILKESKSAKTDEKKLEIVKKYYNDTIQPQKISNEEINVAKKAFDKYTNLGLGYVPYIVEVK